MRSLIGAVLLGSMLLTVHSGFAAGHVQSGRFSFPVALALDRSGDVFVADADDNHIEKLSSTGTTLAIWGKHGSAPGQFDYPNGITLDRSGDVYVTDANNNRVQELTPSGRAIAEWKIPLLPGGMYDGLDGLALDSHGHLYVIEYETHHVVELAPNGSSIKTWGTRGTPYGLAIDQSGHLYVAADVLQEFSLSGRLLRTVGGASLHAGSVALGRRGTLYVTDNVHMRVLKLSPGGKVLAAWGSKGSKPGQFNYPQDVAIDAAGNIYIADGYNGRIQKLSPSGKMLAVWR